MISGEDSIFRCNAVSKNVYFGSKLIESNGVVVATDRLGTARANSNGERMNYYPYGQERAGTGGTTPGGREKFATYFRDNINQDYADQRYYGPGTGRFFSLADSASTLNVTLLEKDIRRPSGVVSRKNLTSL